MKQMEAELGIILPLNEDGKITCVTCHNPHEKGVISTERVGAKGAGEIHRHRLSGNMCIKCHQMR
jgi:cytochrome c peroxidase